MKLKICVFLITFLLPLFLTTTPVIASEKPDSEVTLSEEVYADLAMRHALGHVSVYYFDGDIKDTISINADQAWVSASTIKVYAAMYAFYQVSQGQLSLDQLVTIDPSNVAASESIPNGYAALQDGDIVSVYRLLDQMITQSDNTAFNTLLDLLDRREVTKYIHDLGLESSNVGGKLNLDDLQQAQEAQAPGYSENTTTAADYAKAFILIKNDKIPGSDSLFEILTRQKFNSMLPASLPDSVVVAHKTGELDPYYHDGGIIITPDKKYVLSIFSDEGEPELVAHVSELIYSENINLVGLDINMPKVLAATTVVDSNLPPVLIPADSPLHTLTDLGYEMAETLYPVRPVQTRFKAKVLKTDLAEAKDLLKRGKESQANKIIADVDGKLGALAKEKVVSSDPSLQAALIQVSETRFKIRPPGQN